MIIDMLDRCSDMGINIFRKYYFLIQQNKVPWIHDFVFISIKKNVKESICDFRRVNNMTLRLLKGYFISKMDYMFII